MDAALRTAEVGAFSAPGAFYHAMEQIRWARLSLQQGNEPLARKHLNAALQDVRPATHLTPARLDLKHYAAATVINPKGEIVGEVVRSDAGLPGTGTGRPARHLGIDRFWPAPPHHRARPQRGLRPLQQNRQYLCRHSRKPTRTGDIKVTTKSATIQIAPDAAGGSCPSDS